MTSRAPHRLAKDITERRTIGIRRDFNDLVRDESGKCSPFKIGCIAGQFIVGKYLWLYWEEIIQRSDILLILLLALISPNMILKIANLKFGGSDDKPSTVTTATAEVVTTVKKAKK